MARCCRATIRVELLQVSWSWLEKFPILYLSCIYRDNSFLGAVYRCFVQPSVAVRSSGLIRASECFVDRV